LLGSLKDKKLDAKRIMKFVLATMDIITYSTFQIIFEDFCAPSRY